MGLADESCPGSCRRILPVTRISGLADESCQNQRFNASAHKRARLLATKLDKLFISNA